MNDKKAQTRDRILQAASSALITRGAVAPSVSEIMSAAGLTVGGFYAHFESKDAMMLEVFNLLLSRRRDALCNLGGDVTNEQRRASLAAFYLSRKHRDASEIACPVPSTVGDLTRLPDSFRRALAEHMELMTKQLSSSPEEADTALADMALMLGGLALARALGPGELSDRVLRVAKSAVR